jgi:hypothetical protein
VTATHFREIGFHKVCSDLLLGKTGPELKLLLLLAENDLEGAGCQTLFRLLSTS